MITLVDEVGRINYVENTSSDIFDRLLEIPRIPLKLVLLTAWY